MVIYYRQRGVTAAQPSRASPTKSVIDHAIIRAKLIGLISSAPASFNKKLIGLTQVAPLYWLCWDRPTILARVFHEKRTRMREVLNEGYFVKSFKDGCNFSR